MISQESYYGDYSSITGVREGEEYRFDATTITSGAKAYITIRQGTFDGPVVGEGYSPLYVIARSDENLYAHWSYSSSFCGYASGTLKTSVRWLAGSPFMDNIAIRPVTNLTTGGTYDGFIFVSVASHSDEYWVNGIMTANFKPTVKKTIDRVTRNVTYTTNWNISAKVQLQNGNLSFKAKEVGPVNYVVMETRTGESLALNFKSGLCYGVLTGGKISGLNFAIGLRNAYADRKDDVAQARLTQFKGLYNCVLIAAGDTAGYASLSVGNNGNVKVAGVLPDGTKISGSAKLLDGLNINGWQAVALHKPLYTRRGFFGGLLWINPRNKNVYMDESWAHHWQFFHPIAGSAPITLPVMVFGCSFNREPLPPHLRLGLAPYSVIPMPTTVAGMHSGAWVTDSSMYFDLPLMTGGNRLALPRGTAPKKTNSGGIEHYDYSGENPAMAKISYNARTGIFKGSYKLYFDGLNAHNKLQHKAFTCKFQGVYMPNMANLSYSNMPLMGGGVIKIERAWYPLYTLGVSVSIPLM